MNLYRRYEFPDYSHFLIVDKLIHGCISKECKRKLMVKGKDVSVKDCLELMRRFEAVVVSMKKFEDSGDAHVSYTRDPTKKSQRNGFRRTQFKPKSQPDHKKSQRNPVSGAKGKFIPVTSVQPRMQCANSVASKDTFSEPVTRKGDK